MELGVFFTTFWNSISR